MAGGNTGRNSNQSDKKELFHGNSFTIEQPEAMESLNNNSG
jgi:hypothetical protein